MATTYEWTIETLDTNGDVQDVDFADRLRDLPLQGHGQIIGLMQRVTDRHGYESRGYAYGSDFGGDTRFDNGKPIPQRFVKEWHADRDRRKHHQRMYDIGVALTRATVYEVRVKSATVFLNELWETRGWGDPNDVPDDQWAIYIETVRARLPQAA